MNRYATAVGVFVSVLVLTVGVVAVGGVVFDEEVPEQAELETSHWRLDNVQPTGATEGGVIEMDSAGSTKRVLVHVGTPASSSGSLLEDIPLQGSAEAVTTGSAAGRERSVSALLSTLVANGHEVEFYSQPSRSGSFDDTPTVGDELADADAFVTTAPTALSNEERGAVTDFAAAGGRVFVGADPGEARGVGDLVSDVGVYQETGYLFNIDENDQNYLSIFAEPTGDAVVTEDVDRVVLRGAAPVGQFGAGPTLVTDSETEHSTTQQADTYGVAALADNVTVVGDSSFLQPENAYRADNNVLIGNLADYLVTGTVNEAATGRLGADTGSGMPGNGGAQSPARNVSRAP